MPRDWLQREFQKHSWKGSNLLRAEWIFLSEAGMTTGAAKHLPPSEQSELVVQVMTGNALATSELEGDLLDPGRVQASIRRQMGMAIDDTGTEAAEAGIAGLTVAVVQNAYKQLTERQLYGWYRMASGDGASQHYTSIYQRPDRGEKVIRPAEPPPDQARRDIAGFLHWYALGTGEKVFSPLLRAGLSHLWFESIHPFPCGNGSIGRALAEMALIQGLPTPNYTPLSPVLLNRRQEYYQVLDEACRDRNIVPWLNWFAAVVIESGRRYRARVEFSVRKTAILAAFGDDLNHRQRTVLTTLFGMGASEVEKGIDIRQYRALARTNGITARNELDHLVARNALEEYTDGWFRIPAPRLTVERVHIRDIV